MKTTLKKIILLVGMVFTSTFCMAQSPEMTIEFENAASALELAQNYITGVKNGNAKIMNAQLADDAIIFGLSATNDSLNVHGHMDFWTEIFSKYEFSVANEAHLPVKVTNAWNEGEWLLVWGTNTITDKENGVRITLPYHIAGYIVDGKISKMFHYYDKLKGMLAQGYTLTPPK